MLHRPKSLPATLLALGLALASPVLTLPALAAPVEEVIVDQLRAQGYTINSVALTFLGRIRIDATQGNLRREVVINPRTGEILRDYQGLILPTDVARNENGPGGSKTAVEGVATPAVTDLGGAVSDGGDDMDDVGISSPDDMSDSADVGTD